MWLCIVVSSMAHDVRIVKSWLFLMRPYVGKILNQYWETWVVLLNAFSPVTATICGMLVK
jgi:hypothetical protein